MGFKTKNYNKIINVRVENVFYLNNFVLLFKDKICFLISLYSTNSHIYIRFFIFFNTSGL